MVNVAILGSLPETRKYTAVCRLVKPGYHLRSLSRMELTTAVLSIRVANQFNRELSLNVDRKIFWADSQVALGYIENETKKFKLSVANTYFLGAVYSRQH